MGKKVVMAGTGLVWFGFLIAHVLGNLEIFGGREKLDAYARFLHDATGLLWTARVVLVLSLVLHVMAATQLYTLKARARPIGYRVKRNRGASVYSLIMLWTGVALLVFIVYHILHFTTGTLHPDFIEGEVFHNVVSAFSHLWVSLIYLVAMAILAMHLNHGLFSLTQSLGVSQPIWSDRLRRLAIVFAVVIAAAFALVPVAVLAGRFGAG